MVAFPINPRRIEDSWYVSTTDWEDNAVRVVPFLVVMDDDGDEA